MSSTVNPIKQRPLEPIYAELAAKGFSPTGPFAIAVRDMLTRSDKTTTNAGTIVPQAPVGASPVGIGTTVQNLDQSGNLASLANVNDTSIDLVTDSTSFARTTLNEKTGAGRGFNALNSNNQLASSFNEQPVDVMSVSAAASILSNNGISHVIVIASSSIQFGAGVVSYNSGSVDPGVFGTFYIYASDPTFAGGAVTYLFATSVQATAAGDGLVFFGKITTANGSSNTGGGQTGGTTPGGFSGNRGA